MHDDCILNLQQFWGSKTLLFSLLLGVVDKLRRLYYSDFLVFGALWYYFANNQQPTHRVITSVSYFPTTNWLSITNSAATFFSWILTAKPAQSCSWLSTRHQAGRVDSIPGRTITKTWKTLCGWCSALYVLSVLFIVYCKNRVRCNKKQTPFVNTWKHSRACSWQTEKPSGYLVDPPRSSQDNKKQRKRIKQEHQKIRTKVHQYWFNGCSNLIYKTIFCW